MTSPLSRRGLLLSPLALAACASPLPDLAVQSTTPDAKALFQTAADAHGLAALTGISDIAVSYAGQWRGLVDRLQPALVDAGFRGGSQERILLAAGLTAQQHEGPNGQKHVVRQAGRTDQGDIHVWYNDQPAGDRDRIAAAALVADAYDLFLLGPMWLARLQAQGRSMVMARAGTERFVLDDGAHDCDLLRIRITPGLGLSPADDLELCLEQRDHVMRRVRFTLNGLDSTQGALAEVDTFGHILRRGIAWPTRFHEQLLRPLPLPVHDWRMTGLDFDRGVSVPDLSAQAFKGAATRPAESLAA